MSQGQSDVSEPDSTKAGNSPHPRDAPKPGNSPPAKQAPGNGIKTSEEPVSSIKTSSKMPSPKLEDTLARDMLEVTGSSRDDDRDAALEAEIATVSLAIGAVSGKAANIATRRNWRKTVIGSDHLESFLVRAIIKTSSAHVRRRALDEQAEKLLAAASTEFLDRALAARLKTIDAKQLVKSLAAAGRLGYSESDAVDVDEIVHPVDSAPQRQESRPGPEELRGSVSGFAPRPSESAPAIVPSQNEPLPQEPRDYAPSLAVQNQLHPLPPIPYMPPAPSFPPQQMALPTRTLIPLNKHSCPDCGQSFAQSAGRKYHIEKKVCHNKAPILPPGSSKWQCDNCYRIFTTSAGLTYHTKNNVCRDHEMAKATLLDRQPQRPPPLLPTPAALPFQPSPPFQVRQSSLPQSPHSTSSSHAQSPHPAQSPPQPVYSAQPTRAIQPAQPHPQPLPYPSHPPHNPPAPVLQPAPPPPQPISSTPNTTILPQGLRIYNRGGPVPEVRNGAAYKMGHPPGSSNFNVVVAPAPKTAQPAPPISPPILSATMGSQETPIRMPNLDPARLAEMNARLANEEIRFKAALERIPESLTGFERDEEINKQKAGHATRKSVIRRDYGVQLRKRKNRSSTGSSSQGSATSTYSSASQNASPSAFAPINRITPFRGPPSNMMSVMTSNMTPAPVGLTASVNSSGPGRPQPQSQPPVELENPVQKRRKVEYPDSPIQVNNRGMAFAARDSNKRSNPSDNASANSGPRPHLGDVYGVPGGTQRRKIESGPAQTGQVQASPHTSPMEVDGSAASHAQIIRDCNPPRSSSMDAQENRISQSHDGSASGDTARPQSEAQQPGMRPLLPLQSQGLPAPLAAKLPLPAQLLSTSASKSVPSPTSPTQPKAVERIIVSSGSETSSDYSDADTDIPTRATHYPRRRTSTSIDSTHRTSISMEDGGPSARGSPSLIATKTQASKSVLLENKESGESAHESPIVSPILAETLAAKAASALASAAAQAGDALGLPSEKRSTSTGTHTGGGIGVDAVEHGKLGGIASLALAA